MTFEGDEALSPPQTVIIHQHNFNFSLKGLTRLITSPILLMATLYAVVKTEGEIKEVNWLLPVFGGLCVFNSFF
jgi:hypothetical protein